MEVNMRGFGWYLSIACIILFILMCVILANIGCMPLKTADSPDSGAICMTSEALDRQLQGSYSEGYAKAKAEIPAPADIELKLWDSPAQIMEFLRADPSDRCVSSVPGEDASVSCLDRAQCLTKAIRNKGYDAYGVILNFKDDGSHAIVALPMKDGALLYVEPWLDAIVPAPEIGKPYLTDSLYFQFKTSSLLIVEKIGILY